MDELLFEVGSTEEFKERHRRWFELSLYRMASGKYIARMAYRTQWPSEIDVDQVAIIEAPADAIAEAVEEQLSAWGQEDHVVGYPEGSNNFQRKQKRLLRVMEDHYDQLVATILDRPEFAERIE